MQPRSRRLAAALLSLATGVALTACAPRPAPAPTIPAQPTVAAQPTAMAEPTVAAQPTATAEPTAPQPVAGALLPTDVPWLRLGGEVAPLAEGAAPHPLAAADPSLAWSLEVAANGAAIAYADRAATTQLVVDDNRTGTSLRLPADGVGDAGEPRFAPDGRQLAYTLFGPAGWELRVFELDGGQERVLASGGGNPAAGPVIPLLPLKWTPAGLWVRHVLWASDAQPQALSLLDPATGAVVATREIRHMAAEPAPEGGLVAFAIGEQPIGGQPTASIVVVDMAKGLEWEVAPQQPVIVHSVRWSPDGARLLYATGDGYGANPNTITVVGADGGDPQTTRVDGDGAPLLQDVGWADATTPLALVVARDTLMAELHTFSLNDFSAGPQGLLGARRLPAPDALARIAYLP